MVKITKETNLAEAIAKHPEIIPIFLKYGLDCLGSHVATYETIEQGAGVHKLSENKLNLLLEESNALILSEHEKKDKKSGKK